MRWCLLEFGAPTPESDAVHQVLPVRGGLLAKSAAEGEARLEFRAVSSGREALAVVHDFEPRLLWPVYLVTQAPLHRFVMWAFAPDRCARSHCPGSRR